MRHGVAVLQAQVQRKWGALHRPPQGGVETCVRAAVGIEIDYIDVGREPGISSQRSLPAAGAERSVRRAPAQSQATELPQRSAEQRRAGLAVHAPVRIDLATQLQQPACVEK